MFHSQNQNQTQGPDKGKLVAKLAIFYKLDAEASTKFKQLVALTEEERGGHKGAAQQIFRLWSEYGANSPICTAHYEYCLQLGYIDNDGDMSNSE